MDKAATRRAALIIMAVFFLQPLTLGGWLALIPEVKEGLGLSKGQLAIALMGVPVALVPALQVAGQVIARFGPRRVATVFFPLQAFAFLLPFAAWSMWSLFAALFVAGVMMAFVEVSMNVYAGRLEKREDVLIMNRCHGFWAFGLMVGIPLLLLHSWLQTKTTEIVDSLEMASVKVLNSITSAMRPDSKAPTA